MSQWTYKSSGVDVEAGNRAVEMMRGHVRRTLRPEVLGDIGGFGGLFALKPGYRQPVLVSGADGVGTKLRVAFMTGKHDTVGIDCVAMNVNDILVQGAEPLFFLDYLAVGELDPTVVAAIVGGVAEGWVRAGCALLGGETAEMPGFYPPGEYDLAGFSVGIVERDSIVDGSRIRPGDALIGLPSSGLHSNGFSLARRLFFEAGGHGPDDQVPELGRTVAEELLERTRIYVRPVLSLLKGLPGAVKGMAHITGGGLIENPPRMLPQGVSLAIKTGSWPEPPVFTYIRRLAARGGSSIEENELRRTFNLGIGLVMAVDAYQADRVFRFLQEQGEKAYIIGEAVSGDGGVLFQ